MCDFIVEYLYINRLFINIINKFLFTNIQLCVKILLWEKRILLHLGGVSGTFGAK